MDSRPVRHPLSLAWPLEHRRSDIQPGLADYGHYGLDIVIRQFVRLIQKMKFRSEGTTSNDSTGSSSGRAMTLMQGSMFGWLTGATTGVS
jgi:hypothetical protein